MMGCVVNYHDKRPRNRTQILHSRLNREWWIVRIVGSRRLAGAELKWDGGSSFGADGLGSPSHGSGRTGQARGCRPRAWYTPWMTRDSCGHASLGFMSWNLSIDKASTSMVPRFTGMNRFRLG